MVGSIAFFLTLAGVVIASKLTETSKLYVTSYGGTLTSLSYTGKSLATIQTDNNCGSSPSWLTLDSDRKLLYCLDEGLSTLNGSVSTYRTDSSGKLNFVQQLKSINGPVSAVRYGDRSRPFLAVAHYAGSAVSAFGAPDDGSLTRVQNVTFALDQPGPNRNRQDASHAHEVIVDPTGAFVLSPDLGADLIRVFSFNKQTGLLTPLPPIKSRPGSGPRHAAFWVGQAGKVGNPKNQFVFLYVVGELDNSITTYGVTYPRGGGISFKEVTSTTTYGGKIPPTGAAAAEIEVSPDNRYLIVSNRNDSSFDIENPYLNHPGFNGNKNTIKSDSLATWAIQSDGSLCFIGLAPAGGSYPRHFSLNEEGDQVAIALQSDSTIVIRTRDVSSGMIGPVITATYIPGNLTCVVWDETSRGKNWL